MEGTARQLIDHLLGFVQDPEARFELKRKRKSRSLTQNAYYWAMLGQLASKLRIAKSEVHMKMLREYGVSEVMLLREDVPAKDYFKYYDEKDHGTIKGSPYKRVTAYKRSSMMDSSEFAVLIEGMRYECELQDIDVRTPEEIARMEFVEPRG